MHSLQSSNVGLRPAYEPRARTGALDLAFVFGLSWTWGHIEAVAPSRAPSRVDEHGVRKEYVTHLDICVAQDAHELERREASALVPALVGAAGLPIV